MEFFYIEITVVFKLLALVTKILKLSSNEKFGLNFEINGTVGSSNKSLAEVQFLSKKNFSIFVFLELDSEER